MVDRSRDDGGGSGSALTRLSRERADLRRERVAFVGLGSVGIACSAFDVAAAALYPAGSILCEVYRWREALRLKRNSRGRRLFRDIRCLMPHRG